MIMKSIIFWDMTPSSLLSYNRRFGGTCSLRLQSRRNNVRKNRWENLKSYKNDYVFSQLKVGDNVITEPHCIAGAFAEHISSIFNSSSSVVIPNNSRFTLTF
jgi:hypothetical protein